MTTPVFLEKLLFILPIIIYFHFKEWTFLHPRQFQKIRVFQLENFWIIVNHIWDWLGDRAYKYSDNLPILEKIWYQNPSFIYRLKRWGLFSNTNGIYIIYLNKTKARTMTQTASEKKTYHFGNILILYTTQRKRNLIINNILREFSLLFVSRIVLVMKYIFFLPTPSISMYHHEVEMSVTSQSNLMVAWFFCLINPDLYMTINGETIQSWGETGLMAFYN